MDLPERFAGGDLAAFELLFRQFQPDVYRWLVRLVRDPAAAEELTVEVFWRIFAPGPASIRRGASAPGRG